MDLGLAGKRVIILGGGRSIGRSIGQVFAEEGASVAICARTAGDVDAVVSELAGLGVRAWGRPADISRQCEAVQFVEEAADALGGVDILVANASAMAFGNDVPSWNNMVAVDLLGTISAFEAAKPFLLQSDTASVTIIASASAIETNRAGAYGAVKASLVHYAKGVAREHAAAGIRCNVISPGMVFSPDGTWGKVKAENPALYAEMLAKNPMGRMAMPREIANAVVFLSSPRSGYTTGAHLVIDGAKPARVNY